MSYLVYFLIGLFLIAFMYVFGLYSYSYLFEKLNSTFVEQMGWTLPSNIKSDINILNTILWGFIYVLIAVLLFKYLRKSYIASKVERY